MSKFFNRFNLAFMFVSLRKFYRNFKIRTVSQGKMKGRKCKKSKPSKSHPRFLLDFKRILNLPILFVKQEKSKQYLAASLHVICF
ncbi:MAG: hypothetical protein D6687_02835 [Acidobacteria bacterium]|nr:MAG: hypothetical protein D6687_02835 [Acidobacteriota bacterium]